MTHISWTTELLNSDHVTQDLTEFSCDLIFDTVDGWCSPAWWLDEPDGFFLYESASCRCLGVAAAPGIHRRVLGPDP